VWSTELYGTRTCAEEENVDDESVVGDVPTVPVPVVHPGKCPTCGRDLCGER